MRFWNSVQRKIFDSARSKKVSATGPIAVFSELSVQAKIAAFLLFRPENRVWFLKCADSQREKPIELENVEKFCPN